VSAFTTSLPFSATATATLVRESYGVSRRRADELYLVENLPSGEFGGAAVALLPAIGTDHRVMSQLSVRDHVLYDLINPTTHLWRVVYGVPVFGGAPRNGSRTSQQDVRLTIPTYTRSAATGLISGYVANEIEVDSTRQIRVLTTFPGVPESAVAQASASRVGKVVTVEGVPYQYLGYSTRSQTGSPLVVAYQFAQDAAIAAIPAGALEGSDVAIPAKPVLNSYYRAPVYNPFLVPKILVRPLATTFGAFNLSELPQ
jgi:hypothetical protein